MLTEKNWNKYVKFIKLPRPLINISKINYLKIFKLKYFKKKRKKFMTKKLVKAFKSNNALFFFKNYIRSIFLTISKLIYFSLT